MPKVRASSATIGTMRGPSAGSRSNWPRICTSSVVVERSRSCAGVELRRDGVARGHLERRRVVRALRQVAAEFRAARLQVADLRRALARMVEGERLERRVVDAGRRSGRGTRAAPSTSIFFCWCVVMRPSPAAPHAVALLRLRQDHRRLPAVLDRRAVTPRGSSGSWPPRRSRSMSPSDMCATSASQFRVAVEEVLAVVTSRRGAEYFWNSPSTVSCSAAQQHVGAGPREERIPVRAPQQLDHVPAGAGEERSPAPARSSRCRAPGRRAAAGCS